MPRRPQVFVPVHEGEVDVKVSPKRGLSDDEVGAAARLFKAVDQNHSGTIDLMELRRMFKQMNVAAGEMEVGGWVRCVAKALQTSSSHVVVVAAAPHRLSCPLVVASSLRTYRWTP
jgi:hypothetical protein